MRGDPPSLVSPFGVYLMRVYTEQALPDELLDAARVDGAGEIAHIRERSAADPCARLRHRAVVSFVGTWNNYFLPLLVLSKAGILSAYRRAGVLETQASGWGGAGAVQHRAHRIADVDHAADHGFSLSSAILGKWSYVRQRQVVRSVWRR